jgi:hypothetical protein
VDGDLADWSDAGVWTDLDKVYYLDPNDVSRAQVAMRWDGATDKVYAAVVVDDSNHVLTDAYESWDAGDRVEVFCAGDISDGGGSYGAGTQMLYAKAQQYMVGPNTTEGCWAAWGNGEAIETEAEFEYAVKVDADCIIYEIGAKAFDHYGSGPEGGTIATDLVENRVVGFDIVVDTRWGDKVPGGDRFGMLSENPMGGKHKNSGNFARYVLLERLGGSCRVPMKADLDRDTFIGTADLAAFVRQWLSDM